MSHRHHKLPKETSKQREARKKYATWTSAHPLAAKQFARTIEDLLGDSGIAFDAVTARIKALPSLLDKVETKTATGEWFFPHGFDDAYDFIGVRVTTFHSTEIPEIRRVLEQHFQIDRVVDKAAETRIAGGFGYGSLHLICRIPDITSDSTNILIQELAEYSGQMMEVQIRTVLQHAWAEFEHDVRYKGPNTGSDPRIDRAFTLAAGLIELADQQFDQIASIANQTPRATDSSDDATLSPEILPGVLTVILGPLFPRSKSEYYRYAYAMLAAHGITDVGGLRELLSNDLAEAVRSVMHPDFPPGQVRMVDDVLLARYGRDHIKKTVDIGDHGETRSGRLGNRWKKLLDAGLGAASKS